MKLADLLTFKRFSGVVLTALALWVALEVDSVTDQLAADQFDRAVSSVISVDQRCAFEAKSTAAHAATVGELRAIVAFLDRAGVPRSAYADIRAGAEKKAKRVDELRADVKRCGLTRDRYYRKLDADGRAEYKRRVRQETSQ